MSMFVVGTGANFVEVGFDDAGPNILECDNSTTGTNQPYFFRADERSGTFRCFQGGYHTGGGTYGMAFSDFHLDTKWQASFNGSDVGGLLDENFDNGTLLTNGERHNGNDTAKASFSDLYFGNSTGWHVWGSGTSCGPGSNDPDYNNQIPNNHTVNVSTLANDCPP
jgi:hypothetical protein